MIDKSIFLCPECAALYAESYDVEALPDHPGAKVCECCKRRRLGGMYRVTGKGDEL